MKSSARRDAPPVRRDQSRAAARSRPALEALAQQAREDQGIPQGPPGAHVEAQLTRIFDGQDQGQGHQSLAPPFEPSTKIAASAVEHEE